MAMRMSKQELDATEKRRKEIADALESHGVTRACPRCGSERFSVAGESDIPITQLPGVIFTSGVTVPVIFVVCDKCGYVAQHAKKVLDIS